MTAIVGWIEGSDVYIGGDSAALNSSYNKRIRADEKVFTRNGTMIFGFTTSFRMGQLLRYSLTIPEQSKKQDDYEYMCTTFIDAVLKTLEEKKYATVKSGQAEIGDFLVGYKGALYQVCDDLQVARNTINYDTVGCGGNLAMGAMYILSKIKNIPPKKRIEMALEAAAEFSGGVAPPFKILKLKGGKK